MDHHFINWTEIVPCPGGDQSPDQPQSRGHRGAAAFVFLVAVLLCGAVRAAEVPGCTEDDLLGTLAGGGLVTFTQDCAITLSAPLSISSDTTIDTQGFSVSFSGANQVWVFDIASQVNFTAIGLMITGGQNTNGGGLFIHEGATVVLTNCTLAGNAATGTNGLNGANGSDSTLGDGGNGRNGSLGLPAFGGGAYNLGTFTLLNCTLVTNSVSGGSGGNGGNGGNARFNGGNGGSGGAGAAAVGGGIYNQGTLVLSNCTLVSNRVQAGNGGTGGTGGNGGGGISSVGLAGTGGPGGAATGAGVFSTKPVTIVGCTFASNRAQGGNSAAGGERENGDGTTGFPGGASSGGGVFTPGGAVTNSTFYANTATGGAGGNGGDGSFNAGNGGNGGNASGGGLCNTGAISVVNCTFANGGALGGTNGVAGSGFAGNNGSVGASRGGNIAQISGSFTLRNSILFTNSAGQNAFGTITDGGHNISSDATPTSLGTSSLKKTDPKLGPLTDNGGPTLTMALLTNSPAIDAAGTNRATFPAIDQRGVARSQGKACDIGAFELVTVPAIITQPQSQTQTNGGSVTFTVAAAGNALKYRWQFEGSNIVSALSSTLTLANVTITNAGGYSVIVSNNYGAITSAVAVLSLMPYITVQPTNQQVSAGTPVSFNVTAFGSSSNALSYQWYFNDTDPIPAATTANYTNTNPQLADSGDYSVVVSSEFGSVTSATATLTVDVPPQILVQPASQTVGVGVQVILSVTATGTTPLSYQWYFNGASIGGAVGPTYSFTAAKTDAGTYYVFIGNVSGSQRSQSATLTVLTGPAITGPPQSLVVTQGQNATFSVVATGDSLEYQWTFKGVAIPGATNLSFTVVNAQPADAGNYAVIVTNAAAALTSNPATLSVVTTGLRITDTVLISNLLAFTFQTQTNATYSVQYKTNLSDASWQVLTNGIAGTGQPVRTQDSITNGAARFYRVLAQ